VSTRPRTSTYQREDRRSNGTHHSFALLCPVRGRVTAQKEVPTRSARGWLHPANHECKTSGQARDQNALVSSLRDSSEGPSPARFPRVSVTGKEWKYLFSGSHARAARIQVGSDALCISRHASYRFRAFNRSLA
jgi:hypothetical protein